MGCELVEQAGLARRRPHPIARPPHRPVAGAVVDRPRLARSPRPPDERAPGARSRPSVLLPMHARSLLRYGGSRILCNGGSNPDHYGDRFNQAKFEAATAPVSQRRRERRHRGVRHHRGQARTLQGACEQRAPDVARDLAPATAPHEALCPRVAANQAAAATYLRSGTKRFGFRPNTFPCSRTTTARSICVACSGWVSRCSSTSRRSRRRSRRAPAWAGRARPSAVRLTDRIFRNGYAAHLVADWIPALDGVDAKLRTGGAVADVGCGYGSSTF